MVTDELEALQEEDPGQIYSNITLNDNALIHVAMTTQEVIIEFGWDIMARLAYSPDLVLFSVLFFFNKNLEKTLKDC